MPTAPTPISALPTAPSRSMPRATFVDAIRAWFAAWPTWRTEANALASTTYGNAVEAAASATSAGANATTIAASALAAINAVGYAATSSSSLSLTAGTKTVALNEAGKAFAAQDEIILIRKGDADARMYGSIDVGGVAGQTLTVSVASDGIVGSGGPFTDWIVIHKAFAQVGATADEMRAFTSPNVAATPDAIGDSWAEVTLTDAATIVTSGDASLDMSKFVDAVVTVGGNRTIPNPINITVGKTGRIRYVQDGTGGRVPAFGSYWKRQRGSPTSPPTTTAGAETYLKYWVLKSNLISYRWEEVV